MLMKKLRSLLFLTLAAAGCSPGASSPWILGTFSMENAGQEEIILTTSFLHYEFREDGTLVRKRLTTCKPDRGTLHDELQWSTEGDSLVIVEMPNSSSGEALHIKPGENCNKLQVDEFTYGRRSAGFLLWRGAVCYHKLPPCPDGQECGACETVWCDEPPPPCTD